MWARLCIFALEALTLPAAPAINPCDPALTQESSGPYGYRLRDGICEGLYTRQVAGSAIQLVSLTSSFEDFDPAVTREVFIGWKSLSRGVVHVRARTTDSRLYYRMDAASSATSPELRWPTGLLAALNIHKDRLGLLAWTNSETRLGESVLYLPVRLGQGKSSSVSGNYCVGLVPGRELGEVYITLSKVDHPGASGKVLREAAPLGLSYYPAGQRIDFSVSNPGREGIYYLEIGATLKTGGSITLPVFFYHSGARK